MSNWAYYNENDEEVAAWLRELISVGVIADGIVDTRSIEDVTPEELKFFTQCHFFAGIGVWSYALRLAGWPDDRPVWTGSCPCQPFSQAGKGAGFADERHLWPAWHWLIAECRPAAIFGEQVASKAVEPWIDLVHADLEALGYAFGCVPFPSAGVGAPHIRDRAYWVANAASQRCGEARHCGGRSAQWAGYSGEPCGLADAMPAGWSEGRAESGDGSTTGGGELGRLANADCGQRDGFAIVRRAERNGQNAGWAQSGGEPESHSQPCVPGPTNSHWRAADWLLCRDGRWRPVEPGLKPLAHGTVARVGRLRGYGNAINAIAAAEFIRAYL